MPIAPRRMVLGLLVAVVVAVVSVAPPLDNAPSAAAATDSRLPSHFGFGLAAHPDARGLEGWVPESGVPWDYVYQYLAGGANTGQGWQAWNTEGRFPLLYAQRAAARRAMPVFPYYQLLQSNGPCNSCPESQRDLANLNSASTMAAYYADFATLMKRLGAGTHNGVTGYGGTAIVHVEPDLSGFAQQAVLDNQRCFGHCTGQGNDPSLLRASVASSGVAEVSAYPNTYRGFSLALLHLRDLYAPNVLLAFHVSSWSTLFDVATSTDPSLDPAALGARAAEFARRSGVTEAPAGTSTYDLVFNDVSDRDAGWYERVAGRNVWWDRQNVALPNFHRWERYLAAVTSGTGRQAMVWQVPLGNQVFRTMDDTAGHYQDNRAEYFFAHVDELVASGVVAVLFGRGNEGSTTNWDDRGDGVTNPPASCTSRGLSTGQVCNDRVSTVADDDGGFLRQAGRAYYNAPVRLGGTTPAPPSPAPPAPVYRFPLQPVPGPVVAPPPRTRWRWTKLRRARRGTVRTAGRRRAHSARHR